MSNFKPGMDSNKSVVPATPEAEVGGSLESKSLRPAWVFRSGSGMSPKGSCCRPGPQLVALLRGGANFGAGAYWGN
jgi:hypothetical protein